LAVRYPEQKSIFTRSPLEFFARWKPILRDGFAVKGHQPIREERRILLPNRSRRSTGFGKSRLISDRVNLLWHRFQKFEAKFPSLIGEPPRCHLWPNYAWIVHASGQIGQPSALVFGKCAKHNRVMAHFDRAFSRPAECPAAQINRFSCVHLRQRIQNQAVPDLISFERRLVAAPEQSRLRTPIYGRFWDHVWRGSPARPDGACPLVQPPPSAEEHPMVQS
jgi:hypothetical protein